MLLTESGHEHGLLKKVANSVPASQEDSITEKKKYDAIKKENEKMVNARYMNKYGNGEPLSLPYCAGAGQPICFYKFFHNYTYKVPMGLVKQVNEQSQLENRSKIDAEHDSVKKKESSALQIHEMIVLGNA